MKKGTWVSAAGLAIVAACTPHILNVPTQKLSQETVADKSYKIGQPSSAFVGEAIIQVKEHLITKDSAPMMIASKTFTLTSDADKIEITGGEPLRVVGQIELDEMLLTVLDVPRFQFQITVDAVGKPYKKAIHTKWNTKVMSI